MSGNHAHAHSHGMSAGRMHRGRLLGVLGITTTVLIAEIIGAALTGSLALLADAGHMFTDVAGILLAVLAVTFSARPATPRRTFGHYRMEILAAVINAVLLIGVAVYILIEAWGRWLQPPVVDGGGMLTFAVVGLVANLIGLLLLREGSKQSLNLRGAYLEVVGDLLGSVAVIAAAVTIAVTGWSRADVVASVAVALMILPRTWSLLRDAVDVLLEATPKDLDLEVVRRHILEKTGVVDAHDLHAWTLTSGMPVLSVHIVVEDHVLTDGTASQLLERLGQCLSSHFAVEHCTFQLESRSHQVQESHTHA